jgi:4-amino-4-deoxy-L-arabinose transferase-like glycosyltransferase
MAKLLPLWLFVFALAVRLLLAAVLGLDGLYGQDAFAYIGCAHEILQVQHSGVTPCTDFYWPLGYPLLAAFFVLVTHAEPLGAQLASMVTGAAIAPLAYWMVVEGGVAGTARRDASSSGVAAGLIAALCGTLMLSSIVVMSDAPGLFWATLSACLLLRWDSNASDGPAQSLWFLLAAVALALAVVTRWIFAGLLLPFGVFAALTSLRRLRTARSQGAVVLHKSIVLALLPWAGAVIAFMLVVVPQLYFNSHSGYPLSSDGWIVNWSAANAWRTSLDGPGGHADYRLPPFIFNAEPLFHPNYIFPLLSPCVLYGAWQLRRSPALVLLGGWIVTLYLYLIGAGQENMRFGLAFFTPVAVLAGVGIFSMPMRLRPRAPDSARRWLLLVISLALAIPFSYRVIAAFSSAVALQFSAIRYLQSLVPPASTVVTFELSISLQYYTGFSIVDLFAQSPDSLRRLVCRNNRAYLYVDSSKLESQWAGKSPGENFHWLRDRIGLARVGQQGAWTLYQIRPCSQ